MMRKETISTEILGAVMNLGTSRNKKKVMRLENRGRL